MRIEFSASGGFAGMNIDAVAESGSLDTAQSTELEKLVDEAGFFETKQGWFHRPKTGPGEIAVYRLKLQDEDRKNDLSFSDMDMTPEMSKLFNFMLRLAQQSRPSE